MNNKPTLNTKFENGKVILVIDDKTSIENIQPLVDEFKSIDLGSMKKFVSYKNDQKPLSQFETYLMKKLLSPEQRAMIELTQRVEKLEQIVFSSDEKPRKKRRGFLTDDVSKDQRALRNFHARVDRGDKKAVRIKKLLELAGLKITPLSINGFTPFGVGDVGEIRCVVYIEDLYDQLGEDKFTEIINAVALIDNIHPRLIHFMAMCYALESGKMNPPGAAIVAETYFKENHAKLSEKLRSLGREYFKQYNKKIHPGIVLGKILTGEMHL